MRSTAQGSAFPLVASYAVLLLGIFLVVKMNVIHQDRWAMAFFAKSIELLVCQQKFHVATRQDHKLQRAPFSRIAVAKPEIVQNALRIKRMKFLSL